MVIAAEKRWRIADHGGALRFISSRVYPGAPGLSSAVPLNTDYVLSRREVKKEYPYNLFIVLCTLAIERSAGGSAFQNSSNSQLLTSSSSSSLIAPWLNLGSGGTNTSVNSSPTSLTNTGNAFGGQGPITAPTSVGTSSGFGGSGSYSSGNNSISFNLGAGPSNQGLSALAPSVYDSMGGGGGVSFASNIPTAASSAAYMQNLSQQYAPSLFGSTTLGSAAYGLGGLEYNTLGGAAASVHSWLSGQPASSTGTTAPSSNVNYPFNPGSLSWMIGEPTASPNGTPPTSYQYDGLTLPTNDPLHSQGAYYARMADMNAAGAAGNEALANSVGNSLFWTPPVQGNPVATVPFGLGIVPGAWDLAQFNADMYVQHYNQANDHLGMAAVNVLTAAGSMSWLGSLGSAAEVTPSAYSVAFETNLPASAVPLGTRAAHFQAANSALLNMMDSDPAYASQIRQLIPGVDGLRGPLGGVSYQPPTGWTWNHTLNQPGVMQLVPRVQHTPGSSAWWLMHEYPSGTGGFAQWGHKY